MTKKENSSLKTLARLLSFTKGCRGRFVMTFVFAVLAVVVVAAHLGVVAQSARKICFDGTVRTARNSAEQLYARLVALQHEVIVEGLAVLGYLLYALGARQCRHLQYRLGRV